MATIGVTISTPCGPLDVKVPLPGIPTIDLSLLINFKFPTFKIPFPDCSLLRHLDAAPEPAEDSTP